MARTWKCFDETKRAQLEVLDRAGHSKKDIAMLLGCHVSTIYRELKRGRCKQRHWELYEYYVYSRDVAEADAKKKRANCGAPMKLGGNLQLAAYVERRIVEDRWSPAAVAAELRRSDLGYLCEDTIYRYIHRRVFKTLRPSHLPEKGIRKHPWPDPNKSEEKEKERKKRCFGASIEQRPAVVSTRSTFGHWEMDCVVGKSRGSDQSVLVLTERLTRAELCFKLPKKDSASVVAAMDYLSRRCSFSKIFKTITMDNGSEFANAPRLEHTASGKRRTRCYYCHPYCSSERASNENANRLIRRWFKKGQSLSAVGNAECLRVAHWMNTYPRQILGWKTASEAFQEACAKEGIKISPYLSQFLS